MNNYIPIKKKRNRRSNPDTIIMAARPSGGGKNKIRIRVTIPEKILIKQFKKIPSKIIIAIDDEDTHSFYLIYPQDELGISITKCSPNLYMFWFDPYNSFIEKKDGKIVSMVRYLFNISYAESHWIKYTNAHVLEFKIKEVKHAE